METSHLLGGGASGPRSTTTTSCSGGVPGSSAGMTSQNTQHSGGQLQHFLSKPVSQTNSSTLSSGGAQVKVEVKTEPVKLEEPSVSSFSSCAVKTEPPSPLAMPLRHKPFSFASKTFSDPSDLPAIDVKGIMAEVLQTPSESRRLLIEQVTDAVVDAHLHTTLNTHKSIEEANKRIMQDTEKGELNPDPEKLKTNADIMWQQFVSCMVPEITKVVKFCKKLPGFAEIEQDDQIRLIKQGVFEVMTTRFSLLVNTENETLLDPTLSFICPRDVVLATPMGQFLDEFFYVASKFRPLKLTDGEMGLFTSILIVCPSRNGLKNKIAIGKIQTLFQQALYILMKHNHPDAEERFAYLMGLIAVIRRINEEHFRAINNIRLTLPDKAQFPDLHREVFDTSE